MYVVPWYTYWIRVCAASAYEINHVWNAISVRGLHSVSALHEKEGCVYFFPGSAANKPHINAASVYQ